MALFDFYKKKKTDESEQPPAPVKPIAQRHAPAPQPAKPAEPVSPAPKPVPQQPAPVAQPPRAEQAPDRPASGPVQHREHHPRSQQTYVNWPKYGTGTSELVAMWKLKVFVDAGFVKSGSFAVFREIWGKNRVNQFTTRYFFIPSFEKMKLTPQEIELVSGPDSRVFFCENLDDCFAQMASKGLNWNILWLTTSGETGADAQAAAKKTNVVSLRWYGMDESGKLKSLMDPSRPKPVRQEKPRQEMLFTQPDRPSPIGRAAVPVMTVPGRGDVVTAAGSARQITIQEPVMTDHSSITYRTNDSTLFAKIYTANALRIDLFENKAKRMVAAQVRIPGVCWPVDTLSNRSGAFVGILVPASAGVQLSRSVLSGSSGISQHFPGWDKRDICTVALTILRTYNAVRATGALMGCFNPASVYIESKETVYFVDTDAWQIEGYPVLSRNLTFTPPELLSSTEKLHMYTPDEDNYQAALLAFMLMLPGKYPYAKRKRKQEDDSLRNMSFPFSIGGDKKRSADSERPSGAWQIVWDHLPYRMCVNFYNSFHQEGENSKPGTRLSASTWIGQIEQFGKYLQTEEGVQSRPLFPRTFRRDSKRTFVRCSICGKEHPIFYFLRRIRLQGETIDIWDRGYRVCLPCAVDKSNDPTAHFTCKNCNTTFYYTNRTKIMHEIGKLDFDFKDQKWCYTCKKQKSPCRRCGREIPIYQLREFHDKDRNLRKTVCGDCFGALVKEAKQQEEERKNRVYRSVQCRECRSWFNITVGEAEFFEKKGMNLPSRCPRCRRR